MRSLATFPRSINGTQGTQDLLVNDTTSMIITVAPTHGLMRTSGPDLTVWKGKSSQGLRINFDTISRPLWRHVSTLTDHYRIEKMFVQMVDIFDDAVLHGRGDPQIVKHGKVLHIFAQTHSSRV